MKSILRGYTSSKWWTKSLQATNSATLNTSLQLDCIGLRIVKMEMDPNWEFGIKCHDAEEKNTPEPSTRNWVMTMTTRTTAPRDTRGISSNHLTHAQLSLIVYARSRIGRGGTMGTTGRSVFPFPTFPRAHLLRASLANILTHFLLEILPKNRLFKVSRAFFWSLSGQKEPKLPETLFYKSSTSLPKFDPDAKYPLPNFVLV